MASNEKRLLTQEDVKEYQDKLDYLINVRRPEIIQQIQDAREQGDLSENADYDAAKNEQGHIEEEIQKIKDILDNYELIDSKAVDTKKVTIGTTVTYLDFSDNKEYTFTIVGSEGSDPENGKISNESPLAKTILDLKVNDTVEVKSIDKPYKVQIKKIQKK